MNETLKDIESRDIEHWQTKFYEERAKVQDTQEVKRVDRVLSSKYEKGPKQTSLYEMGAVHRLLISMLYTHPLQFWAFQEQHIYKYNQKDNTWGQAHNHNHHHTNYNQLHTQQ